MNAEIVAVGSELLLGQIVDTNSAWMAQQLGWTGGQSVLQDGCGRQPRPDEGDTYRCR